MRWFLPVLIGSLAPITHAQELVTVAGGVLPPASELSGTIVATFRIARYEVTYAEWQGVNSWAMTNGYPNSSERGQAESNSHPVWAVSWYDAVKWCNALSEREGLTPVYSVNGQVYRTGEFGWAGSGAVHANMSASGYRLPTEAEWEWAARGGVLSQGYTYSGGNSVGVVAWYTINAPYGAQPVGTRQANELGIYDMSGNIMEWCDDAVEQANYRRMRGGSWQSLATDCAVAWRDRYDEPTSRGYSFGFRVAASGAASTPRLNVEQPVGAALSNNIPPTALPSLLNHTSDAKVYTVRNFGSAVLSDIVVSKSGSDSSHFLLTAPTANSLAPGASTTFAVSFTPTSSGSRTAQLSITSNDTNNSPFIINLSGFGLGEDLDSDGDSLNDAAEFTMSALGFDWQSNQPTLVTALYSNANRAQLFTQSQHNANRTNGRTDVTGNPSAFNLFTETQFNANRSNGRKDVISNPSAYSLIHRTNVPTIRIATKRGNSFSLSLPGSWTRYAQSGMPRGWKFDAKKGVLRGTMPQSGMPSVRLTPYRSSSPGAQVTVQFQPTAK